MTTTIRRLVITAALLAALAPAATMADARPWSIGTAHTLPRGRIEVGIFQPLRYGLRDGLEVSTHALLNALMPNVRLKVGLAEWRDLTLAARFGIHFPTPLLMVLSREGTGGVLPPDVEVPFIVGWDMDLLVTYRLRAGYWITGRATALLAATAGESTMPTMDLPLVFPRSSAYHHGVAFQVGVDLDAHLWRGLWYLVDVDLFLMPGGEGNFALEHTLMLSWRFTRGFAAHLGYKMVWGEYPFGQQFHMLPLADVQWAWD